MRRLVALLIVLASTQAVAQVVNTVPGTRYLPQASPPGPCATLGNTCLYQSGGLPVWRKADGTDASMLGSSTLDGAYAAGASPADSTLLLDATRGGFRIWDNATPLAVPLFKISSSGGTTDYLSVTPTTSIFGAPTMGGALYLDGPGNLIGSPSVSLLSPGVLNQTEPQTYIVAADAAVHVGGGPLQQVFNDGAYDHILQTGRVAGGGSGEWLKIAAGDPLRYVDFYANFRSNANPNGTYRDDVFIMGMNCAPGGGMVIAGRGGTCIHFESIWDQLPAGAQPQTEFHLTSTDINGVQTRFISQTQSLLNVAAGAGTDLYIASTRISLRSGKDSNDPPELNIYPTTTTLLSKSQLRYLHLDDDAGLVGLQNGVIGDTDRAHLQLGSNGTVVIMVKSAGAGASGVGRITTHLGTPNYEWDHTLSRMLSPSNSTFVQVDGNEQVFMQANGVPMMIVQDSQVVIGKRLYTSKDALGTTDTAVATAALWRNNTAAINSAQQQYSPNVVLTGYGWDTDGSVSVASSFALQVQPQPGTTVGGKFTWLYSSDEGNYSAVATLDNAGVFTSSGLAVPNILATTTSTDGSILVNTISTRSTGNINLGGPVVISNGGLRCGFTSQSGTTFTLRTDGNGKPQDCIVSMTSSSARTVTLGLAATYGAGAMVMVIDGSSNAVVNNVSVARSGSDTINGGTGNVAVVTVDDAHSICVSDGTSAWVCGINN